MENEVTVLMKMLKEFAKLRPGGRKRVVTYLSSLVESGDTETIEVDAVEVKTQPPKKTNPK